MIQHQVAIAGAGPTGMMLAAELKLAGVDVGIIERRQSAELEGSRAGGLHARSLEILDQRGIVDRFLAEGQKAQVYGFGGVSFDIGDFPSRHPYGLGLWQKHIERILAGWVDELGVAVYRGRDILGFAEDEAGVELRLADGEPVRALYLAGCDGGRSVIRRAAGIDFAGWEPTISHLIAEVELAEEPEAWGVRHDAVGMHGLSRVAYEIRDGKVVYGDSGPVRVMLTEPALQQGGEPTLDDIKAGLIAVYGTDFGVHSPTWISRFTDAARQAVAYRRGRVLLAGDAAHIHYPAGGQGLNTGLQDAVNLGWKLAQVVKGVSSPDLLDTYHAERHPVGAQVLRDTMAAVAINRQDERSKALREVVADLLSLEEARRHLAGRMSKLDVRYDFGDGHPLLGCRMPDLELVAAGKPLRVFSLLHEARPVLINFGDTAALDIAPWADRVRRVDAEYAGPWLLPVIGDVPAPDAVLVRPDGHVAWVGDGSSAGLEEALAKWFGPPAEA